MRSRRSAMWRMRTSWKWSGSTPSALASVAITSSEGTGRFPCTRWFRYPAESPVFSASARYVRPRSSISRWIVGPNGSSLKRRYRGINTPPPAEILDPNAPLVSGAAVTDVHPAVLEALLARGYAHRAADQVGVGELLPRALVAVVEEDGASAGLESGRGPFGDLLGAGKRHQVHVVGCDRLGPCDSELVVPLLDRGRHHSPGADAVAAADERFLPPAFIEERRLEAGAVLGGEVEDVPDLDRRLERERAATLRAAIALERLAEVGERGLVVAPGLDAAEMEAVSVRAGDELALVQCQIGEHLALEADRAKRTARRTEGGTDLLVGRRPGTGLQRREELRLRQPVVAANQRQHDATVVGRHRHRLRGSGEIDAEEVGQRLARRHAGRLHRLGPVEPRREHGQARDAPRDLGIGRVVAALAAHERVLTRARGREEVEGQLAAHDPAFRPHLVGLDAAPLEDAMVGTAVPFERYERTLLGAVERVGVLHDELAHA